MMLTSGKESTNKRAFAKAEKMVTASLIELDINKLVTGRAGFVGNHLVDALTNAYELFFGELGQ